MKLIVLVSKYDIDFQALVKALTSTYDTAGFFLYMRCSICMLLYLTIVLDVSAEGPQFNPLLRTASYQRH